ncbi:hypothetical protein GYN08_15275 [Saccharibacillus sp. VR-M41]|uniref:Aminoglycoside phosphotransferase domain-containing protein n=1 Tax=Saccharibacillus alkalitolerans TaxID=2705290 RepID=A0ABX0F8B7_9BACL|nr:phosphotransferase [Saccharibacillus alkalitolerans]NGZ76685.1 hypothetical protein [Saccharibacillus alkalitolerans]
MPGEENHGLIHGDLHTGNFVFRGYDPFPIDFGRCGFDMIAIMIENYAHHSSDPNETANLRSEQPYALAYIRAYLEEKPFLFERLGAAKKGR